MRIDQHTSNHVPFNSVSTSGLGEELSRYRLFVCTDLLAQKLYHVTNGKAEELSGIFSTSSSFLVTFFKNL